MVRVLGARVVLKQDEAQSEVNGIILPDQSKETPLSGKVVALGPGLRLEDGSIVPVDLKIGDQVIYRSFAGIPIRDHDGTKYFVINEADVLAVVW